jgi:hypothetical protein
MKPHIGFYDDETYIPAIATIVSFLDETVRP